MNRMIVMNKRERINEKNKNKQVNKDRNFFCPLLSMKEISSRFSKEKKFLDLF
jgi:hypothetical protein